MTIVPKRLGVKFSLKREPRIQPDALVPIFQRWIQEHTVDGMLIDVIDYKHVPEGPGIMLIADEGDYAYDLGDGQIGLHYIRKRAIPDNLPDALRLTFRQALLAAQKLEDEAPGDLVFDYRSAKISLLDRMRYRNSPERFDELHDELAAIVSQIYGAEVHLERFYDDPRLNFALRCTVDDAIEVEDLVKRLLANLAAV